MRTTLNISMPASLKREVDKEVKEGSYASISEFFRDTIRSWKEEQLYQSVMRSRKDIAEGKFKKLGSLALLSESSLSKDWLNKEEEKVWQNL